MVMYSLVKINKDTKREIPIVIENVLDEKTGLEVIDRFTSKFSRDELYINLFVEENEKLYIKYKHASEYKYLPILTKENEKFLYFVKDDMTEEEIKEAEEHYITYIHKLLKSSLEYPDYLEFLSTHKYITDHVSGRIHEYLRKDEIGAKVKAKISVEKNLKGYKQLRDLYFGTEAFKHGDMKMNGQLNASLYPIYFGEAFHQCTLDEMAKCMKLDKKNS